MRLHLQSIYNRRLFYNEAIFRIHCRTFAPYRACLYAKYSRRFAMAILIREEGCKDGTNAKARL